MNSPKTFAAYYPSDRNFFLSLLLIAWAAIVSGFGYDMVQLSAKGKLHFPIIVHIHAAAFVGWLVLFTVQILLVRTKNLALHKKLGLISFGLIPVMLILGTSTAITMQKLQYGTPDSDLHFMSVQLGDMFTFGGLAIGGIYLRKNYVAHKRLMLMATFALTGAGFARWFSFQIAPFFGDFFWKYNTLSEGFWHFWVFIVLSSLTLILSIGVYDLITRKQLNKIYLWALAYYVLVTTLEGCLYYSSTWFTMMKHLIGVA